MIGPNLPKRPDEEEVENGFEDEEEYEDWLNEEYDLDLLEEED